MKLDFEISTQGEEVEFNLKDVQIINTGGGVSEARVRQLITEQTEGKYDKTGGVIGGDVSVQGNLSVSGTTTTKDTETLQVKDNVIVANADGVDLVEDSGFAIKTSTTSAYGIMYSPLGDGVKIGLGSFTEDGKFVFDEGEAQFLATRADTLTNGNIPQWDNEKNQFVDSGKKTDDFVPTQQNPDNTYRQVYILNQDGTNGIIRLANAIPYQAIPIGDYTGCIFTGDPTLDYQAANKRYVDDNFVPKWKPVADGSTSFIGLRADGNFYVYNLTFGVPRNNAIPCYVARGAGNNVLGTGIPVNDTDCANKKYVDDNKTKLYLHKVKFAPYGDATAGYITFISTQKDKFIEYNYNDSGMDLVVGIPAKSFERKFRGMILVDWTYVTFSNITLHYLNNSGQIVTLDGETNAEDYTVEEI